MIKPANLSLFKPIILLLMMLISPQSDGQDILIENVTIIDVIGKEALAGQSILISNGEIAAIGPHPLKLENVDPKRLDFSGHYVLPGLFDMHVHLATDPSGSDHISVTEKRLALLAKHGVTGVRDMAGDVRQLAFLARKAMLDEIVSPDIYYSALMAGPEFFDDPRTHAAAQGLKAGYVAWMRGVSSNDDIAMCVAQAKGTGASGIKLYADLPANLVKRVIAEARKQQLPIWGHASPIPSIPSDLVNAGINSLSHATLLAWEAAEFVPESGKHRYSETVLNSADVRFVSLLKMMAENRVYLDPTIHVFKDSGRPRVFDNGVKATTMAYRYGVPFVIGTDAGIDENNFTHVPVIDEMLALVEHTGMTPIDVIQAATLNSANLLNIDSSVGSVDKGKVANLLIVGADPLGDLNNLKKVKAVFKKGKRL